MLVPRAAVADDQVALNQEAAIAAVDLGKIKDRLRATKALGTWTKLRLTADFQEILADIERYYNGEPEVDLPTLRRRFNVLVRELAHRLRGGDPVLAGTLLHTRDAIWQALIRR